MGRRGGGRMGGGFGGGRSGGGRGFGGGSRPGGSFGGGNRSGGFGGGLGGGRPGVGRGIAPRPAPRRGGAGSFGAGMGVGMGLGMMGGGRRRRGWGGGWGMGRRRRRMVGGPMMMGGGGGGGGGGCSGCFGGLIALVLVIFIVSMIGMFANFAFPVGGGGGISGITRSSQVTRSTVNRTALPRGEADSSVPMYVDHLGIIRNSTALNRGLGNFHSSTGVRPILYIVGPEAIASGIPTDAQLEAFAQDRYSHMTSNEAHLLFLFVYTGNRGEYAMWNIAGRQAHTVMDGEAWDILMDYVEMYIDRSMPYHDQFARAFDEAGQRIMTVTRSAWIPVLVVAGILLILLLLFRWWKSKQEQKNIEAEQLERVLAQPLETMGNPSDPASQLAEQYTDDNNDQN